MVAILVIAGDRARARLFSLERDSEEMRELADMVNPVMHLRERQLSRDRQGRGFSGMHASRVTLGKSHPHKRLSSMRFARQVAEAVQQACTRQDYLHIYLLADPEFVGLMRPQMAAKRLTSLLKVIPHSIARGTVAEIRSRLPAQLWKTPLGAGA